MVTHQDSITQALDGLHMMTMTMGSELTKHLILLRPKHYRNQWAKDFRLMHKIKRADSKPNALSKS